MSAIKMNEATPVTLCTVSAARALSDPPQQSSRARQCPRSRIRRASSKLRDRAAMAVVISAASAQAPNRTNSASSDAECRDGRHDISLCDRCPSKPRRNRPTKRLKDAILKMPKLAIALTAVLLSTPAIAQESQPTAPKPIGDYLLKPGATAEDFRRDIAGCQMRAEITAPLGPIANFEAYCGAGGDIQDAAHHVNCVHERPTKTFELINSFHEQNR